MIQKYPIGFQDFGEIRKNGFLYVDKTEDIHRLTKWGGYYFLSRPRRFGKSLLISTLECLYRSRKALFEDTYIFEKWDWETKNPVIRISFAAISHKELGITRAISNRLEEIAAKNKITLSRKVLSGKFKELIEKLHLRDGRKTVVLIDEYDKPIIDFLGADTATAVENRETLKSFYSILKDSDPHLEFVLITGVTKFSKVSIFSDLNNLNDISLRGFYGGICGITEAELKINFKEELKITDAENIKEWYNGYTWDLKTKVYNPFSLLSFFGNGMQFRNFWFETGTPTFLTNLSRSLRLYDFEEVDASEIQLGTFNVEKPSLVPIMFQTGYLTIKSYDEVGEIYTLKFPNREVQRSYLEFLLEEYRENQSPGDSLVLVNTLRKSIINRDFNGIKTVINTLFKSLPYELWQNQNEHFYHALIHLTFKLLGVYVQSEVHSSDGRLDSLVVLEDAVFCFEFKLDKSAKSALDQIKTKGYLTPYQNQSKHCFAIGVNFSSEKKAIEALLWEEL